MSLKLPDFPWDALAPFGDVARRHPDGIIDLSQGTPVDPTPAFIQEALKTHTNSPSYPVTAGTPELRECAKSWARQQLRASGEFDVLPIVGSKELVAWLPTYLESRSVLYPEIAYPTYLVGSILGKTEHRTVEIDAHGWPKADLAWINSPSNPTGRTHSEEELRAAITWARENGSVVISDECYLEFADSARPTSILQYTSGDNQGILALHSLSKRSSMAGYRAALLVGDPILIARIREIRKHAGGMVPLPVQHAMVAALSDENHVSEQRQRYNSRRAALSPILREAGFNIDESGAGLYIWCTRNEQCWTSIEWLSNIGILATPGIFYGEKGGSHIRIAMTASDEKIQEATRRIKEAISK